MSLMLLMTPSKQCLSTAKILTPKGCTLEKDRVLNDAILNMKGDLSKNRFQIPRDERPLSALNISHQLVTLQLFLSSTDDFAVEFNISQSTVAAIKLVIGTHIKETSVDTLHDKRVYRLPLIIPRGKWVQVIFHLSGIMRYLFNLPPMRSIDGFALMGSGKILKMSCGSSEQACIDSTPKGMALFAVPAYAPPVWTSAAAKTEEEPIKARGGGGGMQVVGMNARNAPSSPSRGEKKLPPIAGGKPPQISEERPRSSITETPAAYQRRETPPSPAGFKREYIRFIDTPQAQPPSSRPPARRQETGRGKEPPQTAQVNDVSAWGDNIISAKKRKFSVFFSDPKEKLQGSRKNSAQSKEAEAKETRQVPPARRYRSDVGKPKRRVREGSGDPSNLRSQRLRKRNVRLRENAQLNTDSIDARSKRASSVPLIDVPAPRDTSKVTGPDPICGYGFGYIGILHSNGYYEAEDIDTRLKGVLTLDGISASESDE